MNAGEQKSPEQLLLNYPVNEKFAQSNFLPSKSNEDAVKWIDRWPEWKRGGEDFHCLIIYGPSGSGKTHLAHVWKNISKAHILDNLDKTDFLEGDEFTFIIEDVDEIISDATTAKNLFHLYNWVREQGGYILLTARTHPKKWQTTLADLSSRMLASEAVKIKPPSDELLQAIIIKQFSDRQIILSQDVINYLLPRAERSFDAVRKLVHDIDKLSLSEKKRITIPIVKRVFDNMDEDQT